VIAEQLEFKLYNCADRVQVGVDCYIQQADGCICVFVRNQLMLSYDANDVAASRLAMVQLAESGVATKIQIADAFGVQRTTVFRQIANFRTRGVSGLIPKNRGPKGPRVTGGRKDQVIVDRKRAGESNVQIAKRLGISEASVRLALKRLGYVAGNQTQRSLPWDPPTTPDEQNANAEPASTACCVEANDQIDEAKRMPTRTSAREGQAVERVEQHTVTRIEVDPSAGTRTQTEPAPSVHAVGQTLQVAAVATGDTDPSERTGDRVFARLGLLDDAGPLFGNVKDLKEAGALLAVPVLESHGVFADALDVFEPIGPAFYGLRNVVLTLVLCFVLGINRPENLKRCAPRSLGRVLGLDRAPEMKTLRRKIKALAEQQASLTFARAQMKRHLSRLSGDLLWVYVDGHVSVYSGKRKLKKHHVTRLRLSMPSILDYWVNDANGDPLFVFTGRERKGMVPVLKELIREMRDAGERRTLRVEAEITS
jgi:transposase